MLQGSSRMQKKGMNKIIYYIFIQSSGKVYGNIEKCSEIEGKVSPKFICNISSMDLPL